MLPPQFYFELFEKLRRSFDFTQDIEVTMEANPVLSILITLKDLNKLA